MQQRDEARDESSQTVLVVDDNAATRYATVRVLRGAGFDTLETAGGAQALELARRCTAVLLDVHLPDLHGFEVCRLLRAQPETATLPVIHVSAVYIAAEDQVTGISGGADAYLISPVEPALLVATLRTQVRARTAERALRQAEARLRGIVERAACGIALVDAAGFLVEANPAFAALVDHPADSLPGRLVAELAPRDARAAAEAAVAAWARGPWQGSFPLAKKDGQRLDLAWTVSPHTDPGFSVAIAWPAPPARPARRG